MQLSLPNDPKCLAVLPFVAFLLGQSDKISPKLVVFQLGPADADYVDCIAGGLPGIQMRFAREIRPEWVLEKGILLISFRKSWTASRTLWVDPVPKTIVLDFEEWEMGRRATDVATLDNFRPTFEWKEKIGWNGQHLAWRLRNGIRGEGASERDWLQSFQWSLFLDRIDRLPSGDVLECIDSCLTDRAGNVWPRNHDVASIVHGYRIGIYKIIAERMGASRMQFTNQNKQIKCGFMGLVKDERLTSSVEVSKRQNVHWISLSPQPHGLGKSSLVSVISVRYVVMVPRIVLNATNNTMMDYWQKCQLIVGLVLVTVCFVGIRCACQFSVARKRTDRGQGRILYLFFDTFARSLGVGPGAWLGRSKAERLLLTVISVFAILSGSLFGGGLFEKQLLRNELKFRFNSLDDICLAKIVLYIPMELLPAQILNGRPIYYYSLYLS